MTEGELAQAIQDGARVNFDARAKLYQFTPGAVGYVRAGSTYTGTLAGAVKRFMALTPAEGVGATIGVDFGTVEGCDNGLLTPRVIWAIAGREDCPQ